LLGNLTRFLKKYSRFSIFPDTPTAQLASRLSDRGDVTLKILQRGSLHIACTATGLGPADIWEWSTLLQCIQRFFLQETLEPRYKLSLITGTDTQNFRVSESEAFFTQ